MYQVTVTDLPFTNKLGGVFEQNFCPGVGNLTNSNSQFCYSLSMLHSSLLHVHYLCAEFATFFILSFYHSTSTTF